MNNKTIRVSIVDVRLEKGWPTTEQRVNRRPCAHSSNPVLYALDSQFAGVLANPVIRRAADYIGVGSFKLGKVPNQSIAYAQSGGQNSLHELEVLEKYAVRLSEPAPTKNVSLAYVQLIQDIKTGSQLSSTFDHAVELHKLIANIPFDQVGAEYA